MTVLVVDAANVIGSVPDGWWRDRAGAASRLVTGLRNAELGYDTVVVVLEGQARRGAEEGSDSGVRVVHAPGEGDDELVAQCAELVASGREVSLATADRGLIDRVGPEVQIVGPRTVRRMAR